MKYSEEFLEKVREAHIKDILKGGSSVVFDVEKIRKKYVLKNEKIEEVKE